MILGYVNGTQHKFSLIERELKQPVGGINKTSHYDRKY